MILVRATRDINAQQLLPCQLKQKAGFQALFPPTVTGHHQEMDILPESSRFDGQMRDITL